MAKKKEPSMADAIKVFQDVTLRASLSDYLYVNKTMVSKNTKGNSIVIIPDQELWINIIDNPDLKDHIHELNTIDSEYKEKMELCSYIENHQGLSWVDIDPDILFRGKILKISLKGFDYEIPISRGLLPLKLRKAEYNNIGYCIFTKPNLVLALKKRFDFPAIENSGFTMFRLFQVI